MTDRVNSDSNGANNNHITADEIAVYDRQIRLWGLQAQERIRNAKILLVTLRAVGSEIAKNLVLAGVGSFTILDDAILQAEDCGSQFFVTAEDIGKNRAAAAADRIQKLNPRVNIQTDTSPVTSKSASFFSGFDVIIATDQPYPNLLQINAHARSFKKPFYAACSYGMYAFAFADLIQHDFLITRDRGNISTVIKRETPTRKIISVETEKAADGKQVIEKVTKRETFQTIEVVSEGNLDKKKFNTNRRLNNVSPLISLIRAVWKFEAANSRRPTTAREDTAQFIALATRAHSDLGLPGGSLTSEYIRAFMQNVEGELAPVAAIVGGTLSQEVINFLSGKEQPMQNLGLLDENGYGILSMRHGIAENGH